MVRCTPRYGARPRRGANGWTGWRKCADVWKMSNGSTKMLAREPDDVRCQTIVCRRALRRATASMSRQRSRPKGSGASLSPSCSLRRMSIRPRLTGSATSWTHGISASSPRAQRQREPYETSRRVSAANSYRSPTAKASGRGSEGRVRSSLRILNACSRAVRRWMAHSRWRTGPWGRRLALTHHQAREAHGLAIHMPQRLVWYADAPLLAAALRNDTLARSLKQNTWLHSAAKRTEASRYA
jgi:hypothetical protein